MLIPKSIKVGSINYRVELVAHIPTEDEGYKWGECDYQNSVIRIWDKLSTEKQEQTFIHELTHAIAHEAGIDDQDEDIVNRFALVAHMVISELTLPKTMTNFYNV
ncbi:TPA: ImmA/IrrE family metallo-endopeptidase [Enterococcus faecalis]